VFDITVVEIPTLAKLGHDASQKLPACLTWQQIGGRSDDPKLTVRYRDHALVVRVVG
jgi:hypothetical protein